MDSGDQVSLNIRFAALLSFLFPPRFMHERAVDNTTMTNEQKESIENLGKLLGYFGRHATESIAWKREFEICSQIYNLISTKTDLSANDFGYIVDIFNKINDDVHVDGSGWHGLKIRLNYFSENLGMT